MYIPSYINLFHQGLDSRKPFLRAVFALECIESPCLIAYFFVVFRVLVIISSVSSAFCTFQCCLKAELGNPDSAELRKSRKSFNTVRTN